MYCQCYTWLAFTNTQENKNLNSVVMVTFYIREATTYCLKYSGLLRF